MRVHKTVCMCVYVCVCVCVCLCVCLPAACFQFLMHSCTYVKVYICIRRYICIHIYRERERERRRAHGSRTITHTHKDTSTHPPTLMLHIDTNTARTLSRSCAEELGASGSTNIAFPSSLKHKPCIFVHPGAHIFSLCTCFWQHKCCCLCSWEHKHSCSCSQEPKY